MPKMNITPRTPLTGGINGASSSRRRSVSDEELFTMLESTEVRDANQPRRHGKLTTEERQQVMRGEKSEQKQAGSGQKRFKRRRKKRRPTPKD